jgi:hypothetical protein
VGHRFRERDPPVAVCIRRHDLLNGEVKMFIDRLARPLLWRRLRCRGRAIHAVIEAPHASYLVGRDGAVAVEIVPHDHQNDRAPGVRCVEGRLQGNVRVGQRPVAVNVETAELDGEALQVGREGRAKRQASTQILHRLVGGIERRGGSAEQRQRGSCRDQ